MSLDPHTVNARVHRWITDYVVGLNLCPFARSPWEAGRVLIEVSPANSLSEAFASATSAAEKLVKKDPEELATTLLVLPFANLASFDDFMDLIAAVNDYFDAVKWRGELQLAHFHPSYLLEGFKSEDHAHYLGRAPFPILHFLREEDVAQTANCETGLKEILQRNLTTVRTMKRETLDSHCSSIDLT